MGKGTKGKKTKDPRHTNRRAISSRLSYLCRVVHNMEPVEWSVVMESFPDIVPDILYDVAEKSFNWREGVHRFEIEQTPAGTMTVRARIDTRWNRECARYEERSRRLEEEHQLDQTELDELGESAEVDEEYLRREEAEEADIEEGVDAPKEEEAVKYEESEEADDCYNWSKRRRLK